MGLNIHANVWGLPSQAAAALESGELRGRLFCASIAHELAAASRDAILRRPGLSILAQANMHATQAASLLADGGGA